MIKITKKGDKVNSWGRKNQIKKEDRQQQQKVAADKLSALA